MSGQSTLHQQGYREAEEATLYFRAGQGNRAPLTAHEDQEKGPSEAGRNRGFVIFSTSIDEEASITSATGHTPRDIIQYTLFLGSPLPLQACERDTAATASYGQKRGRHDISRLNQPKESTCRTKAASVPGEQQRARKEDARAKAILEKRNPRAGLGRCSYTPRLEADHRTAVIRLPNDYASRDPAWGGTHVFETSSDHPRSAPTKYGKPA
ncbi:hypothetical protein CORC01_03846 [Colletotrichum orchidophilum]|uniref:Uncharacterized protein n=1 Tax=Colletotrichum orchidophilum TaxID=1209926 RepID=A0A1G4BH90_9PEZI|nr:uncharacterized protein CORC01_03846 [Colletotrichum orchidophilum]OHF00772.1 hypothetical protein CORC01_03846 [Colletotrichum orchidophilum]